MSITAENICNMALGHLKIGKEISNLQTDRSGEAAACRLYYDTVVGIVLGEFRWPFTVNQVALSLVQASPLPFNSDGDSEWAFSYRYPADALSITRIISGVRNESRQDKVPYRIFHDSVGKLILTDMENAYVEYTVNETVEDRFSAGLAMALSLKLAIYIAPRISGGDPFKLRDGCMRLYQSEIESARVNAINEEQPEEEPEAEAIRARY